jgi:hypothetical protein
MKKTKKKNVKPKEVAKREVLCTDEVVMLLILLKSLFLPAVVGQSKCSHSACGHHIIQLNTLCAYKVVMGAF